MKAIGTLYQDKKGDLFISDQNYPETLFLVKNYEKEISRISEKKVI